MSRRAPMIALLLAALPSSVAVAGCGGSSHGETLASARAHLVNSCLEGRTRDRELCACIARELQSHHGYKTAARFDRGRRAVEAGHEPREIVAASIACGREASKR